MKSITLVASLMIVILAACLMLASAPLDPVLSAAIGTLQATSTMYAPGSLLPGRSTPTPDTALATADAPYDAVMPTAAPSDCTTAFPIETVEAIELGTTTSTQLRASFGQPVSVSGRPPRMRFEAGACVLLVTLGADEAEEVELQQYGTLGWVLDRYGSPDAAGIAQGNLTLPLADSAVLLYADEGLVVLFDRDLATLDRDTPVDSLFVRPAYTLDDQLRRLNIEKADWRPPIRM